MIPQTKVASKTYEKVLSPVLIKNKKKIEKFIQKVNGNALTSLVIALQLGKYYVEQNLSIENLQKAAQVANRLANKPDDSESEIKDAGPDCLSELINNGKQDVDDALVEKLNENIENIG